MYLCKENVLKTKKYKSKLINAVHWGAYLISVDYSLSVARLGGFPSNLAILKLVGLEKIALGGDIKFGLVFNRSGSFYKPHVLAQ